jgi:prolyl-tRNA synthetase
LKYKDENEQEHFVVMGSYGIGLGRLIGTVVEVLSDEKGIVWPKAVAPFQIHLIRLGASENVTTEAEKIYAELDASGIEVLFDDRDASAGEKFADADLIGIPLRVVVSERSILGGGVEVKERNSEESVIISNDKISERL